jgi:AcrR family transcriptional regulator
VGQNRRVPTTSPPEPVPGLRERKKARTRAAIQREALRLFGRDGYAGTSVEQIAAAAEVSASTFFRYFPSKEDVVLADFLDERVLQGIVDAPAELSPFGALRHAMASLVTEMSTEEMELETLRNELIRTVPELRRGMISEMIRPMRLLAEALGRRLGRPGDDPDLLMFAGAAVGGLLMTSEREGPPGSTVGEELVGQLVERTERLERMLTLPD